MESTPLTIQSIPLAKIMPNPHQPRRRFKPGSIQEMADSLKALGQQTPAKLRNLTLEERAATPGFEYLLIGGHRRLAGAQLAGLAALDCYVLNITPSETHLSALMDNDSEEMDWWDWDLAIEEEEKAHPGLTQRELAGRLGVGLTKVNVALKVTKALTPSTRELVTQNLDNAITQGDSFVRSPNKTGSSYQITEYVLLALSDLKDASLVEIALEVVIERQMTEKDAKKLVKWVKAGNEPASYGQKPGEDTQKQQPEVATSSTAPIGAPPRNDSGNDDMVKDATRAGGQLQVGQPSAEVEATSADDGGLGPQDPYAAQWAGLPPEVKVTMTPKGYRLVMDLTPAEALPVVYGAMSNWEHLKILSGESHDLRYRNALHQVHKDAVPLRKKEMEDKVLKVGRQVGEQQQSGEEALSGTGAAHAGGQPQVGRPNAAAGAASANDRPEKAPALNQGGLLGAVVQAVKNRVGSNVGEVETNMAGAIVNDAERAANNLVRQQFKKVFKDLF